MIQCPRSHLKARCIERRHDWKDITACIVADEGDHVIVDETHPAYPATHKPLGLGDYVANALSAIGITKERVEAVVGRPCGCDGRQATLNAAGAWLGMSPGSTAQPEIDPPA